MLGVELALVRVWTARGGRRPYERHRQTGSGFRLGESSGRFEGAPACRAGWLRDGHSWNLPGEIPLTPVNQCKEIEAIQWEMRGLNDKPSLPWVSLREAVLQLCPPPGLGISPQNPVLRRQREQELPCESGSRFPTVGPPNLSHQGREVQWARWLVSESGALGAATSAGSLPGGRSEPAALTISRPSLPTLFDGSWSLCFCDGLPDEKSPGDGLLISKPLMLPTFSART